MQREDLSALVAAARSTLLTGSAEDERHVEQRSVERELMAEAVPLAEMLSVIGGDDEERVVEHPAEYVHEPAHETVRVGDLAGVEASQDPLRGARKRSAAEVVGEHGPLVEVPVDDRRRDQAARTPRREVRRRRKVRRV